MKHIWNWYYGKASIRKKLVISYLILVLLPIWGLGSYVYYVSKENMMDQTRQSIEANLSSIYSNLNSAIQRENDNIKYLSYNSTFRKRLQDGTNNKIALADELTRSVEPTLWYFIASDNNLKGVTIYSPFVQQSIDGFLKPIEMCPHQEWYNSEEADSKTHWLYENGELLIWRVLLDADTSSAPVGVMYLELFPSRLLDSMKQSEFLNNNVLLLDENGIVIEEKHTDASATGVAVRGLIGEASMVHFTETKQYMAAISQELVNGWRMVYYVDKQEISVQMREIWASTAAVIGGCLIISTVLIRLLSRLLSARILRLKKLAEQVSRGDFAVELPEIFTDEIGVVEASFAHMSWHIRLMMDEMFNLGLQKRAEELKALQAMINPHFLYNCLSSIKWKAVRSEQDEIADLTGLVAKFYQTALNGGKQITSVKNELENIRAYLEIQCKAHEDSFDVQYVLDEAGKDCEMPNFLLQPVVENAILHGVERCEAGVRGRVKVEYRCEEEYLVFCISNNGPPMNKEDLERILETSGKGYGIHNIRERIRMYYESTDCDLYPGIDSDGMVCFTIRLKRVISPPSR